MANTQYTCASSSSNFVRSTPDATLSLTVAYDGAPFAGFARQKNLATVQGQLEQALSTLFRRNIEVVCAGRTDSGVHAQGQVVSFDLTSAELESRTLRSIRKGVQALVGEGIVIRKVEQRCPGFSARFDALYRHYRYYICIDKTPPLLCRNTSWFVGGALDVSAMQQAAQHLVGNHDFKSFCTAVSARGQNTHRTLHEITFEVETVLGEKMLVINVRGNAFLHSMVRTIVGTLVMVGKHKRTPEWVASVLAACDRQAAGENAPARGLVFWEVGYTQ